jgi:hypothetical protein
MGAELQYFWILANPIRNLMKLNYNLDIVNIGLWINGKF